MQSAEVVCSRCKNLEGSHFPDDAGIEDEEDDIDACLSIVPPTIPTVVQLPVKRHDDFYNMNHHKRGMALIFNHETFDNPSLPTRTGTQFDCDGLEAALTSLGFTVTVFNDLTYKKICLRIKQASAADHNDSDCIFVAVFTHGDTGYLHARDMPYKPDLIWHSFAGDRCPSLVGKPKLFFFQACRGEEMEKGADVIYTPQHDGERRGTYKIPVFADFLIGYSTMPGYLSWRYGTKGSWFIQALIEELNEHGTDKDILSILTAVNRKVTQDYPLNPSEMQKQVPSIHYMFTRTLIFGKK